MRPVFEVYIADRPTNDLTFGKIQMAIYLCEGSSDPLHVWFYSGVYSGVFGVGGSNGAISGFAKSKMAARFIIDCGCSFKLWKVKSLSLHVQCLLTSLMCRPTNPASSERPADWLLGHV